MASAYKGDSQEVRIVLLGVCGAGKSPIGNIILGRESFKESRTRKSEIQRGRVKDKNISIVDTPGFFNTKLTDEELQNEMIKSLYLAYPCPHVFLLIINLETFREEQRNIVEQIQENFGAQALNSTLVLFTGREKISNKEWMGLKFSSKFQELVSQCRDKYHVINSKREIDPTQITELLEKIDELIKQNNHQHYDNDSYLKSYLVKTRKEKKNHEKVKDYRKNKQEKELKKEQLKITETCKMQVVQEKSTKNVETEKKSFITHETKTNRNQIHVYEDIFSRAPEENNDEEKIVKQTVKSLRSSFEKMGVKDTVQKTDKSWEMNETGVWDQKKQQTAKEQHPTQAESIQDRQTKPGECRDLRIVIAGKTGAGKKATGNTIMGQKVFKEVSSPKSVTRKCQHHQQKVKGRNILVIDTPGLFDTSVSEEHLKNEIEKCVEMSAPGPHAFLLVIRLDVRFTDEEKNTVKWIQKNFGEDAAHYTIILFTRGDRLKTSIEEFLTKNKQIRELVIECKGGYHVFNNTDEENQSQVTELLEKIDRMVIENGGEHYTNKMFEEAQKVEEEEKWRREKEETWGKEEKMRQEESSWLMNKAKNVALVGAGAGAAVAGGAVLVAAGGVVLPAALMAGAKAAVTAALSSVHSKETLFEVFKAGGAAGLEATLLSATGSPPLSKDIMTRAAAALDAAVTTASDAETLQEALMTGVAAALDAALNAAPDAPPAEEVSAAST